MVLREIMNDTQILSSLSKGISTFLSFRLCAGQMCANDILLV